MKQWFYFRDLNNNNHSQIILYINGFTVFFLFYFINSRVHKIEYRAVHLSVSLWAVLH